MGRDNFVAPTAPVDILADVLGGPRAAGPVEVPAGKIKMNGGTQMRAGTDDATVFEYGQAMIAANGWGNFPAVIAYHDGKDYWLADGFHRVAAFLESFPDLKRTIPVEVRAGTRRDAVLHAAGANASHGLRRTNQDKRRAVETLLRDEEWGKWNNSEIARRCIVSESLVRTLRDSIFVSNEDKPTERLVTRGGTTYTQNTANIGSKPPVYPLAKPFELDRIVESVMRNNWDLATTNLDDVAEMRKASNTPGSIFRCEVEAQIAKAKLSFKEETLLESFRNVIGFRAGLIKDHGPLQPKPAAVLNTPPAKLNHLGGEYQTVADAGPHAEYLAGMEADFQKAKGRNGPVAADPDEVIASPLDCYDDADANPYVDRMGQLHELKMWLETTRDRKLKEYAKLTGREVPALASGAFDHMIAVLEQAMDALQAEANNVNQ